MDKVLYYGVIALALFVLVSFGYGIFLLFSASVILGAAGLLFFPLATFTGAIKLISGINLATELVSWMGL